MSENEKLVERLLGVACYTPVPSATRTIREAAAALTAAEARIKMLEAQALHHETGERITRKDLNNAYRMGQGNGRLAAELLPALTHGASDAGCREGAGGSCARCVRGAAPV